MNKVPAIKKIITIDNDAVFSRRLDINGEKCSMTDFLYTNLVEEGVDHISLHNAKEVNALNVGETAYIGNSTIIRLK